MKTEEKLSRKPTRWWKHVTIEPAVALFQITTNMSNSLFVNMYLQKNCRYNATVEPDLHTKCDDEKAGQLFVANVNSWRFSITIMLMIAFTVFSSSWSDKVGRRRRPLILIPLSGLVMATVVGCVYSYFWTWPATSAVILEILIHGLTGGRLCVIFSSQLYLCDITSEKNRTNRLGYLHGINIIAIPIGSGAVGFMMRHLGFFNSFVVCTVLSSTALLLGTLFIKDTSEPVERELSFWQTLNPTRIGESFKIIFRKRAYNRRTIIVLLLVIEALYLLPVLGESSVLYLYLRYKFGWNEKDYSLYSVYKLTLVFVGTMFSTSVLSSRFGMHDAMIGSFSGMLTATASICFLFANTAWEICVVPLVDTFHGAILTVASSFITKCLSKHETGHLMSVRGSLQLITPLCFPLYNLIYKHTLDVFPSAFFVISFAAHVPTLILFACVYYIHTRTQVMEVNDQF